MPKIIVKDWIGKEIDQLQNSTIRTAILLLIRDATSDAPIHGYGLSEKLHALTYGEIDVSNATFYAVLRQLKNDGLVEQYELPNDNRKYYRLTEEGVNGCNLLLNAWNQYYNYVKLVNDR